MKLFDTDTCIGLLKGDDAVVAAWRSCGEQCALPSMVIGELYFGAFKSSFREEELERVNRFVDIFPEIRPSRRSMRRFGEIKATLELNALYNLAGAVGYLNGLRGAPLRVREVEQ